MRTEFGAVSGKIGKCQVQKMNLAPSIERLFLGTNLMKTSIKFMALLAILTIGNLSAFVRPFFKPLIRAPFNKGFSLLKRWQTALPNHENLEHRNALLEDRVKFLEELCSTSSHQKNRLEEKISLHRRKMQFWKMMSAAAFGGMGIATSVAFTAHNQYKQPQTNPKIYP